MNTEQFLSQLSKLQKEATPGPWEARDVPSNGLEIYGKPTFAANCAEFTLKRDYPQHLFSMLMYESWLQFPPKKWREMQAANAKLIELLRNNVSLIQEVFEERERLREALQEAWCWIPYHGGFRNPADRGAMCATQSEALDKIEAALQLSTKEAEGERKE